MEHRIFKICGFSALLLIIVFASIYNCLVIINSGFEYRIVVKTCPMIILTFLIFGYMFIYRVSIYSSIILFSLFFCTLGDILIGIYDPSVAYISRNQTIYFIVGGSFFLIARVLFCIMFMFKPYRKVDIIRHSWKKMILSHIIFMIPFIVLGILNIVKETSFITISVFIYMFFGFGIQLSYAFLRIGALEEESKWSSLFGFIGMFLFNISDILLFISMYTDWVPSYVTPISDNIYWLAIYLICISVVRSSNEYIEKGNSYIPISLTIETENFN